MDFDLTSEQSLLKDSVNRLLASRYGSLEARRAHQAGRLGYDEGTWAEMADLGLLGLPFSEEDGGFAGGPVETMIVMEAIGRNLAVEPYFASVVLGGAALRVAGIAEQRLSLAPALVAGEKRLAFAHTERQARHALTDVSARGIAAGEGYRIDGRKSVVLNADAADLLVVSARTGGERTETAGVTLFLMPAHADGVTIETFETQDGGRASEVRLDGVHVPSDAVLGGVGEGFPIIARVADDAIAALAAEAVGCMEVLHALTVDYLKTRKQFGVPIGSFQALQHRAVDMLISLEEARSMAFYAAMMVREEDDTLRAAAMSSVKVAINRACRAVGQGAVQLHGGIGMTNEYIGAHYFKRLAMIESQWGDTAWHLARVAEFGGLLDAEEREMEDDLR